MVEWSSFVVEPWESWILNVEQRETSRPTTKTRIPILRRLGSSALLPNSRDLVERRKVRASLPSSVRE